jgi:lipid II isoglutaminyl synthase (glutamine-hydrolysing)
VRRLAPVTARLAPVAARLAGTLSRRLGRGGGTTLPGVILVRLDPEAVRRRAARLARGSITISATNGKTTTARLVRSMIDAAGWRVVANTAGSNLMSGVAAALLDAPEDAELALLEVDEAALPAVADQTQPRAVVLMNLFRDQLDRYGELETLVAKWRAMVAALPLDSVVIVNADDPSLAYLVPDGRLVLRFGLDDPGADRGQLSHAADSTHCPRCNESLTYDLVTIGHLGHWRCPACGLARPAPDIVVTSVELTGVDASTVIIATPRGDVTTALALPGLHNVYNAAAAVAAGIALELPADLLGGALARTDAAFGRGEELSIHGRRVVMLLAKNPTGANENVRTVLLDQTPLHVLALLNDRTADGRDVSWIWDVDYEPLFERLARLTLGGDRAYDLALRFRYGGLEPSLVEVTPSVADAFDSALAATPVGETLYVLPTYTAMLALRAELARRGFAGKFWEDA